MNNRIFRVNATRLNIRPRPIVEANSQLTQLLKGQAVVRLDDRETNGWWLVFADVAGDGIYAGYVSSAYLAPIDLGLTPVSPTPAPTPSPTPSPSPTNNTDTDIEDRDDDTDIEPTGWEQGWNPSIPEERLYKTTHFSSRGGAPIRRVVIHVTGTGTFDAVRSTFMTGAAKTSAHYVIEQDGGLNQFVSEDYAAHHAGIQSAVKALYDRPQNDWKKYLRYYSWYKGYPSNAVFLDASLNPVSSGVTPTFVKRADGADHTHYDFFDDRWPGETLPIGYVEDNKSPNQHTIGIELVSYGRSYPDPVAYSEAMYTTLAALVDDICTRHNIPKARPFVVGHEDVNPVQRFGWDPAQGFDWDRIL